MVTRRTIIKGIAAAPVLGAGLAVGPAAFAQGTSVKVGSKDFPESIIIGEM
jgi:glycine betaine/choline ABC-type transport system substrate-binding protein